MKLKKSASILRKFLLFNLVTFSFLGLFTLIYLGAIQPNLVKKTASNHATIINNTSDHLERLGIEYNNEEIKKFLLSTRFLFQGLDRVQFYSDSGDLIGDTNILDLDLTVFKKSDEIIQNKIDESGKSKEKKDKIEISNDTSISNILNSDYKNEPLIIEKKN